MLHADPSEIMDINEAVEKLVPLLDDHNEASLRALLAKPTRYVELDRKLTPNFMPASCDLGFPVFILLTAQSVFTRATEQRPIFSAMLTQKITALLALKNQ